MNYLAWKMTVALSFSLDVPPSGRLLSSVSLTPAVCLPVQEKLQGGQSALQSGKNEGRAGDSEVNTQSTWTCCFPLSFTRLHRRCVTWSFHDGAQYVPVAGAAHASSKNVPLRKKWRVKTVHVNERVLTWSLHWVCLFVCFHSLASNLQLTFTGFFHKAGEFVLSSLMTCSNCSCWPPVCCPLCSQGSRLRTVRMNRTRCVWRCCWSKCVTRRGRWVQQTLSSATLMKLAHVYNLT